MVENICCFPLAKVKNLFSVNLTGKFTNIVARWPGSCHDSHIFRSSNICQYLEENHNSLDDGVILGDSGYACAPFLRTPYANPEIPGQEAYNSAHTKTRVVIEQTYGRWKRHFHVLHSEIRMAPEKVCLIFGACAVLHNIAVLLNEPMDDADLPDEVPEVEVYDGPQQGLTIRNHICNTFFGWTFVLISLREIEKTWITACCLGNRLIIHLACLEPLLACLS